MSLSPCFKAGRTSDPLYFMFSEVFIHSWLKLMISGGQWRKRSEELVRSAKLSFSVHAESLRTSASPHTLTLRASADLNEQNRAELYINTSCVCVVIRHLHGTLWLCSLQLYCYEYHEVLNTTDSYFLISMSNRCLPNYLNVDLFS